MPLTKVSPDEMSVPVYGLVILDVPIEVASSTVLTGVAKANVDLTTSINASRPTGAVAVKAILKARTHHSSGVNGTMKIRIGNPDATFTDTFISHRTQTTTGGAGCNLMHTANTMTVNLATGELFAWEVIIETGSSNSILTTNIDLVGYYT